jgi:hypothetical protein
VGWRGAPDVLGAGREGGLVSEEDGRQANDNIGTIMKMD